MVEYKKEGVVRKAVNGMCSMTLLVFLFIVMFFLFPRLVIIIAVILAIPFIWRLLPKAKKV